MRLAKRPRRGPRPRQSAESVAGRDTIIRAARRCLIRLGHARVSTRAVASEAGVNQSLIHYYFGTKDGLILAVLEDMNRELLERQTRMYEAPDSFSDKWAQACRFFEEDLGSG